MPSKIMLLLYESHLERYNKNKMSVQSDCGEHMICFFCIGISDDSFQLIRYPYQVFFTDGFNMRLLLLLHTMNFI